jgi:hypothetical protein
VNDTGARCEGGAWQGGVMGIRRGGGLAGTIVAAVLLVSGCAGSAPEATPSPTHTTPPRIEDLITPTPTPTATVPATAEPVAETVDAGVVAEGTSASASGNGPSNVAYQRQGEFAVVMHVDCSACTGTTTVTEPGRMSPFGEMAAPMRGSFLKDVFTSDPVDQTLIVLADGPWTVTLQSWNDIPSVSGAQSGVGPAVLFLSDDVPRLTVDYAPASADDSFSGRVFTTSDSPKLFGNTEAFSEVYDVDLPGVMAIQTNGTWTVTPTP